LHICAPLRLIVYIACASAWPDDLVWHRPPQIHSRAPRQRCSFPRSPQSRTASSDIREAPRVAAAAGMNSACSPAPFHPCGSSETFASSTSTAFERRDSAPRPPVPLPHWSTRLPSSLTTVSGLIRDIVG
jgi:hypothetical protein